MVESERMSDQDIAADLGMRADTLGRLRRRWGIHREPSQLKARVNGDQVSQADALLSDGYSYAGVSQIMGVQPDTVARMHPGRGFSKEQTIEAANMGRKLSEVVT